MYLVVHDLWHLSRRDAALPAQPGRHILLNDTSLDKLTVSFKLAKAITQTGADGGEVHLFYDVLRHT